MINKYIQLIKINGTSVITTNLANNVDYNSLSEKFTKSIEL